MDASTSTIDRSLPPKAKLLQGKTSRGTHGSLTWQVFASAFECGFYVDREGIRVHTGAAEHDTAALAEKAAVAFCKDWIEPVAHGVVSAEAFDEAVFAPPAEPPPAPVIEALGTHDDVAGWRIEITEGRKGTYKVEVFNARTGQAGALDQDFTGFETARAALTASSLWALERPCDGVPAVVFDDCSPVAVGHFVHDDGEEPDGGGGLPDDVNGWCIQAGPEGDGYSAILTDVESGYDGPERFKHETEAGALGLAEDWAREHSAASMRGQVINGERVDALTAGWAITIQQLSGENVRPKDRPRRFMAGIVDAQTGAVGLGPEHWGGFDTWTGAFTAAVDWAMANPTATHVARREAGDRAVAAADDARAAEVTQQDATDPAAAPAANTEVEGLRRQLEQVSRERDLALEARAAAERGFIADASEAGVKAAQYRELRERREVLIYEIASRKDRLKGVDEELRILSGDGMEFLEALATGARAKSYQQTLTFESSSAVRASVGAQAEKGAAALARSTGMEIAAHTWAFNGVEYSIEHLEEPAAGGPIWTTWIAGHRETTEGHEGTYEDAVELTKLAASVVFADRDPGQTEDRRTPAKRGRKAKLKAHSHDAVLKALREAMHVGEARESLGVTADELDAYIVKTGIVISEHLARDIGQDEPAPAPKPKRGRKPKAVTT